MAADRGHVRLEGHTGDVREGGVVKRDGQGAGSGQNLTGEERTMSEKALQAEGPKAGCPKR